MSTRRPAPPDVARVRVTRYLSALRLDDILVLQGPPLLGAAFALRPPLAEHAFSIAVLTAANACLVAHVFAVNDWANLRADEADPNKRARLFTTRGVAPAAMGWLAAALLALALVLAGLLGPVVLALAAGVAACSALYSLPPFAWKGSPVLNSVVHLAGGTLHFLLGYAAGGALDSRSVAVASFFALVFAAGHLTQEVRDHHGDRRNGIRTNAVHFGPRRTYAASLVLFTLAHVLLCALAIAGAVPGVLGSLVLFYPIHLRWSLDALARGLGYATIRSLQARYRLLYAVMGIAMVATLWLR